MNKTPRVFKTISEMHREFGFVRPLHPLISMLNYNKFQITQEMLRPAFVMDFYNITFNASAGCQMRYGQTIYDFDEGGMFFTAPGQPLSSLQISNPSAGFTLLIHPEFLRNYPLGSRIKHYGFFSYAVNETLHLSEKEKNIIINIAENIENELETAIDDLTQDVLLSHLELLLNYSHRFYKRQFVTRKIQSHSLLDRFDQLLQDYIEKGTALLNGLPTVQYFSDELGVSPRYLSDLLRTLTGQNTQQHIHSRLIEKAKETLAASDLTVGEIAYELGFEHPQSFNRLFKTKTNISPLAYRKSVR